MINPMTNRFMVRLLRFFPRRWWSLHGWRSWKSYIHWRLETYGVYTLDGKTRRGSLVKLLKQFPSYYRWLGQIDRLRRQQK